MKIFSYGSNMLSKRIKDRINSYSIIDIGSIKNHKLKFHKKSKDESGKADAFFTGNKEDIIWGVVGEIDENEKQKLDRLEGLGKGYNLKSVIVNMSTSSEIEADIYIADEKFIDSSLEPYDWYREFVLRGSIENSLPKDYIKNIETVSYKIDGNKERSEKNYKIINEAGT